jgi:FAD binding domain
VAELVRATAGLPEVAVMLQAQVPDTDVKVFAFPIAAHIAASIRAGRVFLVGDAAHTWPPTGSLGANTGIQDTHNLAWKLAAVGNGTAGPGLLDTYDAERRPTGLLTMGQALARLSTRMAPGHGPEVLDDGAVTMGYQYRSSAILGADGDPRPLPPAALTGQPGTRAPTCRSPSTTAGSRPWSCTAAAWRSWRAWRAPGGSGRWPACRSRWTPTASGSTWRRPTSTRPCRRPRTASAPTAPCWSALTASWPGAASTRSPTPPPSSRASCGPS